MSVLSPSDKKRVYDNILGAIGCTPLIRLGCIAHELACPLYAKMEIDPGGRSRTGLGCTSSSRPRSVGNSNRAEQWSKPPAATPAWDWRSRPRSKVTRPSSSCRTRCPTRRSSCCARTGPGWSSRPQRLRRKIRARITRSRNGWRAKRPTPSWPTSTTIPITRKRTSCRPALNCGSRPKGV